MADSSYLGVNKGLSGGVPQLALVLAFSLVFLFLARSATQPRATLAFLASMALAEAFHSAGEAMEVSSTLVTFPSFTFLAFSAVSGVSFVIHKFLEGFVLGMIAVGAGVARGTRPALAGLAVVASDLFGILVGVYSPVNTAPLFAAGAAGWAFITVLVAFQLRKDRPALLLSPSLLGFLIVYGAGTCIPWRWVAEVEKNHAIAMAVAGAEIVGAVALYFTPAYRPFTNGNTSGSATCPSSGVNGTDFLVIATHDGFNGSVSHGSPIHPWPIRCVREGSAVHIEAVNHDSVEAHGFAIDNYFGTGVALAPGDAYSLTFVADKAGTFELYCNIFCSIHAFTVGEVIVYQ